MATLRAIRSLRVLFLVSTFIAFSNFAAAIEWCDLPVPHRLECRNPLSPLRTHPGNCPPLEEMRECEVLSTKICQIEHYDNIDSGFGALNRQLNAAISASPNNPFIMVSTIPNGNRVSVQKPIKLPAKKYLRQVSQQHYAVCLVVETDK